MNADTYQIAAARTLIDEPDHPFSGNELMLMWCTLGLTGEAGEVAEHIKKGICHQHGLDHEKLTKELGDVLWYVAGIATLIGVPLSDIMDRNIAKLRTRYPNGYDSADSQARVDTIPNADSQAQVDAEDAELDRIAQWGSELMAAVKPTIDGGRQWDQWTGEEAKQR